MNRTILLPALIFAMLWISSYAQRVPFDKPLTGNDFERIAPLIAENAKWLNAQIKSSGGDYEENEQKISQYIELLKKIAGSELNPKQWLEAQSQWAIVPAGGDYDDELSVAATNKNNAPTAIFTFDDGTKIEPVLRKFYQTQKFDETNLQSAEIDKFISPDNKVEISLASIRQLFPDSKSADYAVELTVSDRFGQQLTGADTTGGGFVDLLTKNGVSEEDYDSYFTEITQARLDCNDPKLLEPDNGAEPRDPTVAKDRKHRLEVRRQNAQLYKRYSGRLEKSLEVFDIYGE
jgi:hypothetical protein